MSWVHIFVEEIDHQERWRRGRDVKDTGGSHQQRACYTEKITWKSEGQDSKTLLQYNLITVKSHARASTHREHKYIFQVHFIKNTIPELIVSWNLNQQLVK